MYAAHSNDRKPSSVAINLPSSTHSLAASPHTSTHHGHHGHSHANHSSHSSHVGHSHNAPSLSSNDFSFKRQPGAYAVPKSAFMSLWSPVEVGMFLRRAVKSIVADRRTRNVFFFLLLNLSFMVVEVAYGLWCNSLGLIGDGVHMLFDSSALIFSLLASVVAKWDQNELYSYGYGRVEILAGFLNCCALFVASFSIVVEAVGRLVSPQDIQTDSLLLVAVLGFIVNLVGIFAFDHGGMGHSHHDHSGHQVHDHHEHSRHDHGTGNILMHGMFLHILADTLGSVGVIISTLCIQYFGWTWSDPVCSLFMAALIFMSIWPLFKRSGGALLQQTPSEVISKMGAIYQHVMSTPGVTAMSDSHFWEQASEQYVGTLRISVNATTDDQLMIQRVHEIISQQVPGVRWLTIQIDRDQIR